MDIGALEKFVILAESSSINEAAKKLYISQPSLTKALQNLEKDIGVTLFVRKKSGTELTEEGKIILPEAKAMIACYYEWKKLGSISKYPVSINIYVHAAYSGFFSDMIMDLKAKFPKLKIKYLSTYTPERYVSSNGQEINLVLLICNNDAVIERLEREQTNSPIVLIHGQYMCMIKKDSELAGVPLVKVSDLKRFYHVELPMSEESATYSCKIREYIDRYIPISQNILVDSTDSVFKTLRKNNRCFALGFYPTLLRYQDIREKNIIYVPFAEDEAMCDLILFYPEKACKKYPVVQEILLSIQEAFKEYME